jgi:hypothetical protein
MQAQHLVKQELFVDSWPLHDEKALIGQKQ